jgi:hypothetical protein
MALSIQRHQANHITCGRSFSVSAADMWCRYRSNSCSFIPDWCETLSPQLCTSAVSRPVTPSNTKRGMFIARWLGCRDAGKGKWHQCGWSRRITICVARIRSAWASAARRLRGCAERWAGVDEQVWVDGNMSCDRKMNLRRSPIPLLGVNVNLAV